MRITDWERCAEGTQAVIRTDSGQMRIYGITEDIFRCVYTKRDEIGEDSPIGIHVSPRVQLLVEQPSGTDLIRIAGGNIVLEAERNTGRFCWYRRSAGERDLSLLLKEGEKELTPFQVRVWTTGGEAPVVRRVKTVDGDRNFIDNLKPVGDHEAYRAKLHFQWEKDEQIHGLGQGEEGIYGYRNHVQYLYQHNMRIPMPWILSDRGYALLFDCGSLMTFNDDERGSWLFLDTVNRLDYYFLSGESFDDLIRGSRYLTGKASMLPKWAFGYVQSKERYENQEELIETAREYRLRKVGLDCIVQDWKTWEGDRWGEKKLDPSRYPDKARMRAELHEMNVHSMISVWPNMNYDSEDCRQMSEAGCLLNDLSTYDAFSPQARRLYWKQAEAGLYRDGFDSWWCDSTEPFSGPDWGGETMREPWERYVLVGEEHKKYLGAERANLYALFHAQGMFENQKEADPDHRMLNLTRSGYLGSQRYGAMLWSGDTAASWKNLRIQLTESLNMAVSGYPYWTMDAGGFFTVKENWRARGCGCADDPAPKWFWRGDFEEGTADPGYRELYVRWLQMAVFLPMMRSHGTDTPREIWQFGEPGEVWYDAIASAIALRYRLMPYIYSLAGAVWLDDALMERPLLFDFAADRRAAASDEAFLVGKSLLVIPVTGPMEYGPGGKRLNGDDSWECYLPEGADWYFMQEGIRSCYEGGQTVTIHADLKTIPVFVRSGSIVPMEHSLQYAGETVSTPLELVIYPGRDAQFDLYEDDGDGYGYLSGAYQQVRLTWNDREKKLTIGEAKKTFPGGIRGRSCRAILGDRKIDFVCSGEEMEISF